MPTKVEEAREAVIACCECDWHGTPKCDASEAVARLESAIREEERAKAELAIKILIVVRNFDTWLAEKIRAAAQEGEDAHS